MDARTRVDTQVVGALPLVGAILTQWGLLIILTFAVAVMKHRSSQPHKTHLPHTPH